MPSIIKGVPTENKKVSPIIIALVIIVILVIGVSYFYKWNRERVVLNPTDNILDNAIRGVLPSIETNVIENKPDVNPVNKANPYKDIKTNPF